MVALLTLAQSVRVRILNPQPNKAASKREAVLFLLLRHSDGSFASFMP